MKQQQETTRIQHYSHHTTNVQVPEQCVDGHLFPGDALSQHVSGERGEAEQGLQNGVHVACVSQIGKPTKEQECITIIITDYLSST